MKRNVIRGSDEPIHLTPEGLAKLKARLEHLKKVLPERIAETARTAAYGDRSENAEYKQAKGTLRRTHFEIWQIEDQLKRINVIEKGARNGTIGLGATVTLKRDGQEMRLEMVGPQETDPSQGRISHLSPIGAELMGRRAGDTVEVKTNAGKTKYEIVRVE